MHRFIAIVTLLVLGLGTARAQDDGFKPLFNGKDLTGWYNVNCAPGTFFVKDNMIITTGKPTGYLRTDRHYSEHHQSRHDPGASGGRQSNGRKDTPAGPWRDAGFRRQRQLPCPQRAR